MRSAQEYNERLREVKDDFSNINLPQNFGQLRGELETLKNRLHQQVQQELEEERAKLAAEWEKLKKLREETGAAVAGKLQGARQDLRDRLDDARENLRGRFDSVSLPPQLAKVKEELEKAMGNVHLPPAAVEQLERLQRAMAAEKAELAEQMERLKQSHAAALAASAAAALILAA